MKFLLLKSFYFPPSTLHLPHSTFHTQLSTLNCPLLPLYYRVDHKYINNVRFFCTATPFVRADTHAITEMMTPSVSVIVIVPVLVIVIGGSIYSPQCGDILNADERLLVSFTIIFFQKKCDEGHFFSFVSESGFIFASEKSRNSF